MIDSMTYDPLYTTDSKGKIRIWQMEVCGCQYRTTSGLLYGEKVTTEWTTAVETNVGKKHYKTAEQQAHAEVASQYKKKISRKYYDNLEAVGAHKYVQPMLAKSYKDIKNLVFPVYSQPKSDGIRAVVTISSLSSREGKPIRVCDHLLNALGPVFDKYPKIVLDGELYNHELKADFNQIASIVKQTKPTASDIVNARNMIQYHIYDIIVDGMTMADRNRLVGDIQGMLSDHAKQMIKFVPTLTVYTQHDLDQIFQMYLEQGYEGQMVRILSSVYEHKRSKNLIKRKIDEDAEFEVIEILEGNGNWAGLAKSVECVLDDGRKFRASIPGNKQGAKQLLSEFREGKGPKYATVKYGNLTPDGIPRFGVVKTFHDVKRDM